MVDSNSFIGKVVYSRAGRDKGKIFIVVDVLDSEYVYISDGSLRPMEKPKKKKIKHLTFTNINADEIRNRLVSDNKVTNVVVRKFLQSYDNNKEV